MKLTYIFHSGFAIELENLTIIIDYYKDSDNNVVKSRLLKNKGSLYVLCTHSHTDHFNKDILKWKHSHPDIKYIFSKDILDDGFAKQDDAVYLDRLDVYEDAMLRIKAFGSTDKGISFFIEINRHKIFHAGDLNNWHWNEESTPNEIAEATNFYLSELGLLSHNVPHMNLAMFPIDSRLGKDYMIGAEQFVDTIKVDVFVPMHFDKNYEKANAFEQYANRRNIKFLKIEKQGQIFDL